MYQRDDSLNYNIINLFYSPHIIVGVGYTEVISAFSKAEM